MRSALGARSFAAALSWKKRAAPALRRAASALLSTRERERVGGVEHVGLEGARSTGAARRRDTVRTVATSAGSG